MSNLVRPGHNHAAVGLAPTGRREVRLSDVLSALSYALDLTEGQRPGHSVRTCLIGMRLANELALPADQRSALYYALLLKDAGCSSNAARMAALFGTDDQVVKPRMKLVDWHQRMRLAGATARIVGEGRSIATRVRHFLAIARYGNLTRDLIAVRCERGADIATRLGFPPATADAIRFLDEHWCGLGYPQGLAGEAIPLLARIINIAQAVEVFHDRRGLDAAMTVVRQREGTWFDPRLSTMVLSWRRDNAWWSSLHSEDIADRIVAAEPADRAQLADDVRLDDIAGAFADIIDAKSPFTFSHSTGVAKIAVRVATALGLDEHEQRRIQRAALLHDIGKLGVSNRILDKAGPLSAPEWTDIQKHPKNTLEILTRVGAFVDLAWTAALHHERLDGSGYPWQLDAAKLDESARLLAVADTYEALTSDRPYRRGMTHDAAIALMQEDVGRGRLCGRSVQIVAERAGADLPGAN